MRKRRVKEHNKEWQRFVVSRIGTAWPKREGCLNLIVLSSASGYKAECSSEEDAEKQDAPVVVKPNKNDEKGMGDKESAFEGIDIDIDILVFSCL